MTYNIKCTFRGRLDPGKGIDLLLEILPQLIKQSKHDREFHIFGSGTYYNDLAELSQTYPQIKLYGRATRDQIKPVAQAGHYCLCPSTFLETFGMTALEGCKLGLPVIGPNKGGLQQFIIEDLIIQNSKFKIQNSSQQKGEDLLQLLLYIDQYHHQKYQDRQQQTLQIASQYCPEIWLKNINQFIIQKS